MVVGYIHFPHTYYNGRKEGEYVKPDLIMFTDGSVRQWTGPDGRPMNSASYGVVVLNTHTTKYTIFGGELQTLSSATAETIAYYRGLKYVRKMRKRSQKHRETIKNILVVTDSKLNVDIFHNDIPESWSVKNGVWRKSNGSAVRMQAIYEKILELIQDMGICIKFVHINSHLRSSDWKDVQNKLAKSGVHVTENAAKMFIQMNGIADRTATEITQSAKVKSTVSEQHTAGRRPAWKRSLDASNRIGVS